MTSRNMKWVALLIAGWLSLSESGFAQGKLRLLRPKDPKEAKGPKDTKPKPDEGDPDDPSDGLPDSPLENKLRQAQAAYEEERFDDCIKMTTEVLNADPRHGVARYTRASALIDLGRESRDAKTIRAGVADAREALGVAGNQHLIFHIPYFYGLTSLAEIENRRSHAELSVNIAGSLLQREDLTQDVRGMVYFQRGLAKVFLADFKGAAADYSAAIELDPKFQAAHFGRADAFVKAGDMARASASYDKAALELPKDPLVYNNRGTFNLQQGRVDAAIVDFSRALQLDATFAMAALNRGYAYSQKQAWHDAEVDYVYSLEADPEQPLVLRLLGTVRMTQGKLKLALDAFNKAVALDPNTPDNYSGRGFARFFSDDYAGAVADFNKTLQLSPATTMVIPWKYCAQIRAGQTAAAKKELQAFLQSQPKTPNWHVTLGQYLSGAITDEALIATTKNTTDVNAQKQWLCEARFFQGLQFEAAGQEAEARALFAECVKTQQIQLTAHIGAKLALSVK